MARCNPERSATPSDVLPFLRAWLSNPWRVSAIAPSSSALADLITSEIGPKSAPVLELGAGTGVFTRALLKRGLAQEDLTIIELGPDFVTLLRQRFPNARILPVDAARLAQAGLYEGAPVGAVVSGLPLLSMSPRKIMAIVAGAFFYMRPGGSLYQFTYGPRCPVPRPILDRLGLKAVRIGRTMLNVPPASVYRITRRSPLHGPGAA
ncbi:methyltransferase domain-containing protein [Chelativorans sp. AA-79]|uniref:class I SAM-dependent methyltransferase n=1 Tax=Chelativorans sp. AA-79 TaxID=3028735 RepID=UPI0023F76986|nr:methyltransferase domain-containing protein [Chelativorans sp. AA-79]WEX07705.1 methyltransferase domain-containing protein [Chelativorans sp. AA-79]